MMKVSEKNVIFKIRRPYFFLLLSSIQASSTSSLLFFNVLGGFLDPNRRISSLGRLTKGNNLVSTTNNGSANAAITTTSSRSLHAGGPTPPTNSVTPQSTSATSTKQLHQPHSTALDPTTSLSLSKPIVRLAYAGRDKFHLKVSNVGPNRYIYLDICLLLISSFCKSHLSFYR